MAYASYSSDHVRIAPDRSRSRDEPMWQHRSHTRQRQSRYRDAWHDVPPVRQPRRVLIIVNLEAVRPLMTAVHDDAMDSTTCRSLPSLGQLEEYALLTIAHLQCLDPPTSHRDTHGEYPVILHQPAHHVHLGSPTRTHIHGSSMARQHMLLQEIPLYFEMSTP